MSADPGSLTTKLTLYNPVDDLPSTDWGAPDGEEYQKSGTLWGDVEEDAGQLDRRAGRDEPEQRATITIRDRDDVTTQSYFEDGKGRKFWVTGLRHPDDLDRWLEVQTFIEF